MKSLLSNVKKIDLFTHPFPHIVIYEPLEEELCLQLCSQYPALNTVTKGADYASNQRFSYCASEVFHHANINPLWQEFVQTHTSHSFLREVINLFAESIRCLYPNFESEIGALETLTSGVRNIDTFSEANVLLDAQVCVNTPVVGTPSSVRTTHVDLPNKLFAGLYYLRSPEDTSTGGDLELYKFKSDPKGFKGVYVSDRHIEAVKTIKYQRNVLVLFINSIYSLHGVTVRSKTDSPRYFFNLLGEVKQPLFDLSPYQERDWLSKSMTAPVRTLQQLKKLALFS